MSMFGENSSRWSESMVRKGRGGLYSFDFSSGGRTKQEFADECDINNIIARFNRTGMLPPPKGTPSYMDVSNVPSLQESLQILSDAELAFSRLPAKVRAEFHNDPMRFVEFASNAENADRMREMGLLEPLPKAPDPVEVRLVNEPESVSEPAQGSRKRSSKGDSAD